MRRRVVVSTSQSCAACSASVGNAATCGCGAFESRLGRARRRAYPRFRVPRARAPGGDATPASLPLLASFLQSSRSRHHRPVWIPHSSAATRVRQRRRATCPEQVGPGPRVEHPLHLHALDHAIESLQRLEVGLGPVPPATETRGEADRDRAPALFGPGSPLPTTGRRRERITSGCRSAGSSR